jgi:hypothetical protein
MVPTQGKKRLEKGKNEREKDGREKEVPPPLLSVSSSVVLSSQHLLLLHSYDFTPFHTKFV